MYAGHLQEELHVSPQFFRFLYKVIGKFIILQLAIKFEFFCFDSKEMTDSFLGMEEKDHWRYLGLHSTDCAPSGNT